jgi:phosphoribosyl-AMP cyclohydrolase
MLDIIKELKYEDGLIHAVAQDYKTGEVLMCAHMNLEALLKTIESRRAYYWSQTREKLWRKGETSGHEQIVREILIDCDADTVLLKVEQIGGACHTGYRSCFYRDIGSKIVGVKVFKPEDVYSL